jgi:hypothetical protein
VESDVDNEPPELIHLSFYPDPIDVNDNADVSIAFAFVYHIHTTQYINALLNVVDNIAGVWEYSFRISSPSGIVIENFASYEVINGIPIVCQ